MSEVWKDVVGYENIYEVSENGKVRTVEGKTTFSVLHGERKWKQRTLKLKTDKLGYKRVSLWKDKNVEDFLVHRLVAFSFLEKVEGKDLINHKDCNPANNNFSNLEWCNHKENLMHAFKNRLNKSPKPIVLLNVKTLQVEYFYSYAEASRYLGKNDGYISSLFKRGINEVEEFEFFTR